MQDEPNDKISPVYQAGIIIAGCCGLVVFVSAAWYFGTVTFIAAMVIIFLILFVVIIALLSPESDGADLSTDKLQQHLADLPPLKLLEHRQKMAMLDDLSDMQKKSNEADVRILKAIAARAETTKAEYHQWVSASGDESIAAEYYQEVWIKLWTAHGTSSFTTDDVIQLGNTITDANDVLVYLKERGALTNIGLRTFELSRPPDSSTDKFIHT